MLVEQAFLMLPEILHGSGYQQQDYEAGLVGAFSLSLLQVLNGHNTPNPIACMQHEKLYRSGGIFPHAAAPRYLRADLFLNIAKLYVANRRLSQYGWRHEAWLETKFVRNQAGDDGKANSTNKTAHTAAFLADLIRLITLVPEPDDQSKSARYFLHVYDAHPDRYLTFRGHPWVKSLTEAGRQTLTITNLGNESQTLRRILGDLDGLTITAQLTNLVLSPIEESHRPVYYCYLTRIDSFTCSLGDDVAELTPSRRVAGSDNDQLARIAAFVAARLHIKTGSSEETAPLEPEPLPEDQQDAPNAEA